MAGALLDPGYRAALSGPDRGRAWFASEQRRVHAEVNRVWPRRLGTTPLGMAGALTAHSAASGIRYGWRNRSWWRATPATATPCASTATRSR